MEAKFICPPTFLENWHMYYVLTTSYLKNRHMDAGVFKKKNKVRFSSGQLEQNKIGRNCDGASRRSTGPEGCEIFGENRRAFVWLLHSSRRQGNSSAIGLQGRFSAPRRQREETRRNRQSNQNVGSRQDKVAAIYARQIWPPTPEQQREIAEQATRQRGEEPAARAEQQAADGTVPRRREAPGRPRWASPAGAAGRHTTSRRMPAAPSS